MKTRYMTTIFVGPMPTYYAAVLHVYSATLTLTFNLLRRIFPPSITLKWRTFKHTPQFCFYLLLQVNSQHV